MHVIADGLRDLGLSFIVLFVAIDAPGNLPFVLGLTSSMTPERRSRVVRYAIITALLVGVGFLFIGRGIFYALGIKMSDFLVAGGLILFALAASDLIYATRRQEEAGPVEDYVGIVPLGTPLVAGPAVLTALFLLTSQYSYPLVVLAFVLNLALAWFILRQANLATRLIGPGGLRGLSKVASLVIAAFGVRMIRLGITNMLGL